MTYFPRKYAMKCILFLTEAAVYEIQVWKFFFTFADVLELPSFTLDEFVQSLHDYVSYFPDL
jgi:hypothetical protein